MGTFFSGNMVGGGIRMLDIPVLPGAQVKFATLGAAAVQGDVPAVVSVGSRAVSLWDEFAPLKRYIGYIDDANLMGSFLAAATITERKLSADGKTIHFTAEGISEYLKGRYFADITTDFYEDVDGSLGGISLKDQDFNPSSRVSSSWLDHALDALAARSVWTDPAPIYGGTRNQTVPITYSSIGSGHGAGGSRLWPYNSVKELMSVWDRMNLVISDDETTVGYWTVRPTLNGQTSTSMGTALHLGTSTSIDWNVVAGDFVYTGEPEIELRWAPATSERVAYSSVLSFELTERAAGFSNASQKPTARTGGTWVGYSDVYLPHAGTNNAQTDYMAYPIVESRFLDTFALANPVGNGWATAPQSAPETEWVLEIPRESNLAPMWNLPGREITFKIAEHPVLGTTVETLTIESVEVTTGAPSWTIRAK